MKKRDTVSIGDIYGGMLNNVRRNLRETHNPKTFDGVDATQVNGKGPEVDGYNKALNDCDCIGKCTCLEEDEEDEDCGCKKGESCKNCKEKSKFEKKELKESKKVMSPVVNKRMSDLLFDKLLKKVLTENFGQDQERDDVDALGLDDATPDSDMDDDFGAEEDLGGEEDTVSFTLDRETAQKLVDVLQGVLGGDEEGGDEDLDFGGEDDFGGDDMDFEEDEEDEGTKPASGTSNRLSGDAKLQGKNNKVGGPGVTPKHTKANSAVTDKTGTEYTEPSKEALQSKSNQVPGSRLKQASDYFKL